MLGLSVRFCKGATMRTLTRVAIGAAFLAVPGLLATDLAMVDPAYPQDVAAKGGVTVPKDGAPVCGMDFDTLVGLPGWRILKGDKLRAYLETAFTPAPNGDALAYIVNGDKVAVVLGRNGCVVGRQVIPAKVHKRVVLKALGMAV